MNVNGFQSTLKYDDKSQELKSQMLSIQMEKSSLEKNLNEQNSENETVLQLLEQTESKHVLIQVLLQANVYVQ